MLKIYRDKDNIRENCFHPLHDTLDQMGKLVEHAAEEVYNLSALCGNKKFNLWSISANNFVATQMSDGFLYTRYGYAVEEYFNMNIYNIPFPMGWSVETQVSHGSTRPDVVIYYQGQEYAWLDITSCVSVGHIFGKAGAGWRDRPFVAELLYPMMETEKIILQGGCGIAQRAGALHATRMVSMRKRALLMHMVECTDRALERMNVFDVEPKDIVLLFSNAFGIDFYQINNRQIAIKTILKIYKMADSARYPHKARQLLNTDFYKGKRQDSSLANYIIKESYKVMPPKNNIYITEQEMDELLGD